MGYEMQSLLRVDVVLSDVRILRYHDHKLYNLSVGEKYRVAIVTVLSMKKRGLKNS